MRTSFFSYRHFSVNTTNHRHVDYDDVQPNSNLYHTLYFTLDVHSDLPDNSGDENDVSVESALSCIQSNNSIYEPDFTAKIVSAGDDENEEYIVCLELPILRVQEQLTPEALVMGFARFEDALYNTLSHYRNGEDYDNDNDVFYGDGATDNDDGDETNDNKLYVDGQMISTDDLDSFMLGIRDDLFIRGFESDMNYRSVEFLSNMADTTSQSIENQILKAFIHWNATSVAKRHAEEITKGAALLTRIEKDCNFQDVALVYKS